MFDNFAFNQKADSDTTSDDDNSPPSPKSKSSEQPSPTMATLATPIGALFNQDGDRIDCLVRKMSQQTFVRDSRSTLSFGLRNCEADSNLSADRMSAEIQIEATSKFSVTETPTEADPNQPIVPAIDSHTAQLQQQTYYGTLENHAGHLVASESSNLIVPDGGIPWRQPEMRPNNGTSNPRTLDLLTTMVENGVQCNVHASRPTSPMPSPYPLSSNLIPPSSEPIQFKKPDYNINPRLMHDSNMELEVDLNFCNGNDDDDTYFSGPPALRDASTPAGIRKFGYLKYRSSYEAAAKCKNMRKNTPRMRKRPKVTRPSASAASTSAASSTTL
ncbi:uncharacterized protein GGS22DRAFT_162320 [Annulohypoxylon maeteangense]|uniref:uncharacterized protein n=1 Tax=Annulohypoxylon maeteangense TaxID=1927788 RepID=UPI0020085473|nr:uncharacterized protein GGS22DRAFT_162320 [Annulohypoxylon maeteangense]KAI0885928.1 hypothetical protein GGS22DRAFT_162320 [Annulohypoxylon maeteangense]